MTLTEHTYDPDGLAARLADVELIRGIHVFQSISSTNLVAKRLAESGAETGTLVLADRQTAGRGRHGRRWESPAGLGLWFSLVLRPQLRDDRWHLLPMLLSELVARSLIQQFHQPFHVKWPNDVIADGKKLCGILCESSSDGGRMEYIVAGIGLNVRQSPDDFPAQFRHSATSLRLVLRRSPDRTEVLVQLLHDFSRWLMPILRGERPLELSGWRELCADFGRAVRIRAPQREWRGILQRVSAAGDLVIRDASGREQIIPYGQASLRVES
ncbi:MAG: biotin--[acetyl-CoA-carboxylase] ligase [candidate division KSB1 bacterium]|nr:biotin--[acetyl-CoA-carboxylase] ligase [candidate division KSB1 bacterium]MDQ7066342.1 biotin--[acetyl-CoA-carboxylase] ligase [candidate division KSB1 bacterium]